MSQNRGKQFETVILNSFKKVRNVSIDRIHDQMSGYAGSKNVSDFIVYKYPYEFYIECKTHHGNTLPFSCITDNQYSGMLEKIKTKGVFAGIMCWFIDHDITVFIPIEVIKDLKDKGFKSFNVQYVANRELCYNILGIKKRVFFDYDMGRFFEEVTNEI